MPGRVIFDHHQNGIKSKASGFKFCYLLVKDLFWSRSIMLVLRLWQCCYIFSFITFFTHYVHFFCYYICALYIINLFLFYCLGRSNLRTYAHDDVSVGSWFIGLDVKHIDERKFCCSSWATGLLFNNFSHSAFTCCTHIFYK